MLRTAVSALAFWIGAGAILGQTITEFQLPNRFSWPQRIVAGPDGALWFTENGSSAIGRLTTSGALREFPIPSGGRGFDVAVGPDGAIWFTEYYTRTIGRIAADGTITEYPLKPGVYPTNITAGPDNALWFTDTVDRIGRLTLTGGESYFDVPHTERATTSPLGLAFALDGNLWFTCEFHVYGRLSPAGEMTLYRLDSNYFPGSIAIGPDGGLWFMEGAEFGDDRIARINPDGTLLEFDLPFAVKGNGMLSRGDDGGLWSTAEFGNFISRISMDGRVYRIPLMSPGSFPEGITGGPDGALWFVETGTGRIGRIDSGATLGRNPRELPFR